MTANRASVPFFVAAAYFLFFFFLVLALQAWWFPDLLDRNNFLNADAEHYFWIKDKGYLDFRVAFFPLFPLIWKFSHLGIYGIALFNLCLFVVAFGSLAKEYDLNLKNTILCLSIPSLCFIMLPYTESVFFASSVIVLIGLKRNVLWVVSIGLFLCSLSRPAFTVFIPALLIAELATKGELKDKMLRFLSYLIPVCAGVLLVALIQHHDTGKWFEFFAAQKGWGNELQVPKFPLTSWGGDMIVRLDGSALLLGAVAGCFVLTSLFKKSKLHTNIPKEVAFSLCYLGGMALTVLLFRGGSLFSLNRFVFATPFIMIALNFYSQQTFSFSNKQVLLIFLGLLVWWLAFGSYVHIQTLLKYTLLSGYLLLIVLIKTPNEKLRSVFTWLLIVINIVFQVTLCVRFLQNEWVA